jgi:hypothetical protein
MSHQQWHKQSVLTLQTEPFCIVANLEQSAAFHALDIITTWRTGPK